MSCVHFSGDPDAWCNAQAAPDLPWTMPEKRKSKIQRLWRLAASPVESIRASAAGSADCPPDLLAVLATDESVTVRAWVCRNLKTPKRILKILADDPDNGVRSYAMFRLKIIRSSWW